MTDGEQLADAAQPSKRRPARSAGDLLSQTLTLRDFILGLAAAIGMTWTAGAYLWKLEGAPQRDMITDVHRDMKQVKADVAKAGPNCGAIVAPVEFEWQWAGENWLVNIALARGADGGLSGPASFQFTEIRKVAEREGATETTKLMRRELLSATGTWTAMSDGRLDLKAETAGELNGQRLRKFEATLECRAAYAGKVQYFYGAEERPKEGDAVLVRHDSGIR